MTSARSVPLQDFIQTVQSQLDTAQTRMSLKAQNEQLPLTFAIRDISMDLKAHIEIQDGEMRIMPARPSDSDASTLHFVFTAITKPMINENASQLSVDRHDDQFLDDFGDTLDEDERRRLEWIGVRTVGQLNDIKQQGLGRSVGRITKLPVEKLEHVLARASRPMVSDIGIETVGSSTDELRQRLRVRGTNMLKEGAPPRVTIAGKPVSVVRATETDLLLAPGRDQFAGQMSLAHDQRAPTELWFDQAEALASVPGDALP